MSSVISPGRWAQCDARGVCAPSATQPPCAEAATRASAPARRRHGGRASRPRSPVSLAVCRWRSPIVAAVIPRRPVQLVVCCSASALASMRATASKPAASAASLGVHPPCAAAAAAAPARSSAATAGAQPEAAARKRADLP
eukprot:scaffold25270_cov104-Isochrysis_galbana.AAC.2